MNIVHTLPSSLELMTIENLKKKLQNPDWCLSLARANLKRRDYGAAFAYLQCAKQMGHAEDTPRTSSYTPYYNTENLGKDYVGICSYISRTKIGID